MLAKSSTSSLQLASNLPNHHLQAKNTHHHRRSARYKIRVVTVDWVTSTFEGFNGENAERKISQSEL
jgi:hypothetical protein